MIWLPDYCDISSLLSCSCSTFSVEEFPCIHGQWQPWSSGGQSPSTCAILKNCLSLVHSPLCPCTEHICSVELSIKLPLGTLATLYLNLNAKHSAWYNVICDGMYKNNTINIKKQHLFCYDCLNGQLIQKKLLKQVEWPLAKAQNQMVTRQIPN